MNELDIKIQTCIRCQENNLICDVLTYQKPKSFYGSEHPTVMIIGHSPTVRTSEKAEFVLKLDKPGQPLYKYIYEKILRPLGLDFSMVYATNLIKCETKVLPEDLKNKVSFFEQAFENCSKLLEMEIEEIRPDIIISLSERVLKVLSKKYLNKELKMQESFGNLFQIEINGKVFQWIPLVHIPKGENSKVALHYFPEQTKRLEKIKTILT